MPCLVRLSASSFQRFRNILSRARLDAESFTEDADKNQKEAKRRETPSWPKMRGGGDCDLKFYVGPLYIQSCPAASRASKISAAVREGRPFATNSFRGSHRSYGGAQLTSGALTCDHCGPAASRSWCHQQFCCIWCRKDLLFPMTGPTPPQGDNFLP